MPVIPAAPGYGPPKLTMGSDKSGRVAFGTGCVVPYANSGARRKPQGVCSEDQLRTADRMFIDEFMLRKGSEAQGSGS